MCTKCTNSGTLMSQVYFFFFFFFKCLGFFSLSNLQSFEDFKDLWELCKCHFSGFRDDHSLVFYVEGPKHKQAESRVHFEFSSRKLLSLTVRKHRQLICAQP